MQISLSWYQVKDMEAAKQFYGGVLGLKKTFEMDGWVEFSHSAEAASIGLSQATGDEPSGGATVVLRVPDIDKARKDLAGQGVNFEGEIQEIPGVVRLSTFRDPSGNKLQLVQVLMPS